MVSFGNYMIIYLTAALPVVVNVIVTSLSAVKPLQASAAYSIVHKAAVAQEVKAIAVGASLRRLNTFLLSPMKILLPPSYYALITKSSI
jgi:hypothetical protein